MIVRIIGEGQFELESKHYDELNAIDDRLVEMVSKEDEEGFTQELEKLVNLTKRKGRPLDPSRIAESDLIIPPPDITLEEAKEIFRGEGLFPDLG